MEKIIKNIQNREILLKKTKLGVILWFFPPGEIILEILKMSSIPQT